MFYNLDAWFRGSGPDFILWSHYSIEETKLLLHETRNCVCKTMLSVISFLKVNPGNIFKTHSKVYQIILSDPYHLKFHGCYSSISFGISCLHYRVATDN